MQSNQHDGRTYSYVPPREAPAELADFLHRETAEVDPTTFEVLRHALWNIIMEHGTTIVRTSGSVAVAYSHDFNPVILDEWGDFVFLGPWLQYLVAASPPAAKWTMQNRHPSPGIAPGCMFLTNDPWIGATHQSDVSLLAPVFVEDKLFAWVGNSLHHADLGGTAPGGFNPVAPDVFHESGLFPPIRLVEHGEIRRDLEEEFLRRSRMPDVVAVDLRAQVAGCRVAVERLEGLIERHGAPIIKGVMRKVQDDSQRALSRRLESIPDGEWSEEAYLEMAEPGDRQVHRNAMTLRKEGDQLTFSNVGTDPQIGGVNCTLPAYIGAIAAMINTQLMWDQLFAVGGALRNVEFESVPGTVTSALFPSSVSLAVLTLDQCIALAGLCISKMLSCSRDPQLRKEAQSSMGTSTFPVAAYTGVDEAGAVFANIFTEPMGAGLAAWSFRDGIDVGGWSWDPLVAVTNVEQVEEIYPLVYLWRRVMPDSGGAGEYRGGNSMEVATMVHGAQRVEHFEASSAHHALPLSPLFGGYPNDVHRFAMLPDTDVAAQLAAGRVPTPETLDVAAGEDIPARAFGIAQGESDVFALRYCASGGFGDPLRRNAELVATDVAHGRVSAGEATRLYRVALDENGELDAQQTARLREQELAARKAWRGGEQARTVEVAATDDWIVGPQLRVVGSGAEAVFACADCAAVLAPLSGNWKDGARIGELTLPEANRLCIEPTKLLDEDFVLRQYACPGCARLLDSEVQRSTDEPTWDLRIEEVV
jgi:N-methylhydantoinase B